MGFCSRLYNELSRPGLSGFFDLTEGQDKVVNPGPTFGPHNTAQLTWRIFVVVFAIWALYDQVSERPDPEDTFIYLTNITYLLSCIYFISSLLCSISQVWSREMHVGSSRSVTPLERFSWLLFAVVLPSELIVVILYWGMVYDKDSSILDFFNILSHGLILPLVAFDGWAVGRIPIRAPHVLFSFLYGASYVVWTVIYMYINTTGGEDDDYYEPLYNFVKWKDDPSGTARIFLLLLFAAFPLMFLLCWFLSTFLPKRYVKESERLIGGYSLLSEECEVGENI